MRTTSTLLAALLVALALPRPSRALPPPGARVPRFSVDDIEGVTHSERDLRGRWSVALVMTDKDVRDDLAAWWRRLEGALPASARMYTFGALNIVPLVPTAVLVDRARDSTPRSLWRTVWFSRDGSFARALGLPEEELPWVVVIDPEGRIVTTLHERVSDDAVNRVLARVPSTP
ncbi:MAG: hypothetical protein U0325_06710 [Polyangiales bacterium]